MKEIDMASLKTVIKSMQKPQRFQHTLGVEKEVRNLGRIFLPDKVEKLAIAAILHDITKDFSTEKQFELCEEYGIDIDKKIAPKLLHSITGSEFARRKFGSEIVDDEIYDAIKYHTVGRENMTTFEQLVYLADYIEENRTFSDCQLLRHYFYTNVAHCTDLDQRKENLRRTMVLSFNLTIQNLMDEGKNIDLATIKSRNYFLNLF